MERKGQFYYPGIHRFNRYLEFNFLSDYIMENYVDLSQPKKKKKVSKKYSYTFGDIYPGMNIGHKHCVLIHRGYEVPANMGWLWNLPHNIRGLKYRRGWHPGAVGKTIAKMMKFKCKELEPNVKDKQTVRKGRVLKGGLESEEPMEPKPALKVRKKGDVFIIQINPMKDLSEITSDNPYIDCDPLVIKIIKKQTPEEQAKEEALKMSKLKKQRDAKIRKALAEATEDICKCAYMDVFCNNLNAIDPVIEACPFQEPECICQNGSSSSLSSNATWDIEYTPPVGCLETTSKKQKIHVETQYIAKDAGISQHEFDIKRVPLKSKRHKK